MAATGRFDTSRLSFGEIVAGASSVVLLIVMFLPWYGATAKVSIGGFNASRSETVDAWEAYNGRDILLFLIVLVVIGWVVLRALDAVPANLGFDSGLVILVLGGLAALMVLIGILHIPTGGASEVHTTGTSLDFSRKFWIFVGFLATLGIGYGGWAAYNERRRGPIPAAAGPGGALSGPGAVGPSPTTAPTEPLAGSGPPASPSPPGPASSPPPLSSSWRRRSSSSLSSPTKN